MIGFTEAKGLFFDSQKVMAATTKAERKVLSKFGAFVRKRARTSIRKRNKISEVGKPPSSHDGTLKRGILFAYDADARSVVIGPVRYDSKAGTAQEALEKGGPSVAVVTQGGKRVIRKVVIKARPFMGPAFEAELPNAEKLWADAVV